ncbi:hypothetical protein B0H34DRAFT_659364, partial [Crassisporium funariophilum]
ISCRLCGETKILVSKMRDHVGAHILRALRIRGMDMVIGENPCGWCGFEGCKTHLTFKKRRKNPIISSNCPYHYDKLIYSKASVSGKTAACTNVPLPCPICPKGRNDQSPAFWKYNLIAHMTEHHLVDERLPPFPPELRKSAYISRAEENRMGVELVATIQY